MVLNWVVAAIAATGANARRLPDESLNLLLATIHHRYLANTPIHNGWLWEAWRDSVARYRPDGWRLATEYAAQQPILIFYDGAAIGFEFSTGTKLRDVLNDCPGFELYVTDREASFVLCHNHHDNLSGVGACREWLRTIPEEAR
jgi:hypothetical protein